MRIITKTYPARALSTPVVIINLLEFKQKPLINGSKTLENGWNISLGDNFNVDIASKSITLPINQETSQHIVLVKTTKENQRTLFKDIQLAFKQAKKVK